MKLILSYLLKYFKAMYTLFKRFLRVLLLAFTFLFMLNFILSIILVFFYTLNYEVFLKILFQFKEKVSDIFIDYHYVSYIYYSLNMPFSFWGIRKYFLFLFNIRDFFLLDYIKFLLSKIDSLSYLISREDYTLNMRFVELLMLDRYTLLYNGCSVLIFIFFFKKLIFLFINLYKYIVYYIYTHNLKIKSYIRIFYKKYHYSGSYTFFEDTFTNKGSLIENLLDKPFSNLYWIIFFAGNMFEFALIFIKCLIFILINFTAFPISFWFTNFTIFPITFQFLIVSLLILFVSIFCVLIYITYKVIKSIINLIINLFSYLIRLSFNLRFYLIYIYKVYSVNGVFSWKSLYYDLKFYWCFYNLSYFFPLVLYYLIYYTALFCRSRNYLSWRILVSFLIKLDSIIKEVILEYPLFFCFILFLLVLYYIYIFITTFFPRKK